MSFFIEQLTIIGVGLMGGSLAQALRRRNLVGKVVGMTRRRASVDKALEMGVIDRGAYWVEEAVSGADLVLVSTPVSTIVPMVQAMAGHLKPGAVVTDVGSVKASVVKGCEDAMSEGTFFVGGHPIAGREHVGVGASLATLFEGSRTVLTPSANTDPQALKLVRQIWETVGSHVEIMDPDFHDRVLAATSHLPHLMAYNIVNTLSDLEEDIRSEVFRYAAGGFRDFTRIASSDPTMWRDICLENQEAILEMLHRFKQDLTKLERRVKEGDADALYGIFARSKNTRDRVLAEHTILRGDA